jgi:histidine triad (HIT) family protein
MQLIPRTHFPYFDALPPEMAHEIFSVAQRPAPVLRNHSRVERVAFLFTGTDIAYTHAHGLPLVEASDITSRRYIVEEQVTFGSTPRVPDSELAAVAAVVKAALENLPS